MVYEAVARLSAWPALICYVSVLGLGLRYGTSGAQQSRRILWTAGWFALVIHVGLAFYTSRGEE